MKSTLPLNIAVIGAGKVGTVLGRLLVDNGENIVAIVSRSLTSAKKAGKFLQCRNVSTSLDVIPPSTNLIFITTPHSGVEGVVAKLMPARQLSFKKLAVCHASGMMTSEVLESLRLKGATVFSFHPLQTFPRDFDPEDIVESVRGIYYGIDGTPQAIRFAKILAAKLGGRTLVIPPDMREFYHAACVVASNHLTTMLSILQQMFGSLRANGGEFFSVFEPIIMATLQNVKATSPAMALSGPIARGGVETVADHLASIKRFAPQLLPYFATLSAETVRLAQYKGSIDDADAQEMLNVIQSSLPKPQLP